MSAKSTEEQVTETAEVEAKLEKSGEDSCKTSGVCRPHTSFYLSVIAILLAAYAAIAAGKNPAVPDAEARLSGLESSVQGLNDQIAALGKDVESNRDNLIQNQLKKALLNIQEVGSLAKEETKASIAEVEKILSDLTSAAKATIPETEVAPANEPAAAEPITEGAPVVPAEEATAEPAPSEEAAPAADDAAATEAPVVEPEPVAPAQPEAQAF